MAYPQRLRAEAVREVAFGAVTALLTAVGAATTHIGRIVRFVNNTNQDVYFSLDGANNNYRIPAYNSLVLDISTNQTTKDNLLIPEGQYFYIAHAGVAPTLGNAWIEYSYGG